MARYDSTLMKLDTQGEKQDKFNSPFLHFRTRTRARNQILSRDFIKT